MGLKYKNSTGEWVPVPIPSEINDAAAGNTTTYSSSKIEELVSNKQDLLSQEQLDNIANVPTKTSQLENDSGFLTEHQDISHLQEKLSDEQLSNIADIPNKVSADYVDTAIQTAITDVLGGAS